MTPVTSSDARLALRHGVAAVGVVALAAALAIRAPAAEVNRAGKKKDPAAVALAQAEKRAGKVTRKLVKAGVRRIRSRTRSTLKHIRRLTKALQKGRDIEELSGVASPGKIGVIAAEQARGVVINLGATIEAEVGETTAIVHETLLDVGSHEDVRAVLDDPCSTAARIGGGGFMDNDAVIPLEGALGDSARLLRNGAQPLQAAANDCGAAFNLVLTPPTSTNPLVLVDPTAEVFPVPQIVATIAIEGGELVTVRVGPEPTAHAGLPFELRLFNPQGNLLRSDAPSAPTDRIQFSDLGVVATGTLTLSDGVLNGQDFVGLSERPVDFPPVADTGALPIAGALQPVAEMVEVFLPPEDLKAALECLTKAGPAAVDVFVCNSNPSIVKIIPTAETEIVYCSHVGTFDDSPELRRVLDSSFFPEGQGDTAFAVLPETPSSSTPSGAWHVLATAVEGRVPLQDSSRRYQYGFVFDTDGNSGNNYTPSPPFTEDYFKNTDRWYAVEYQPGTGWVLKVTDARGGSFLRVASAARALVRDNCLLLAVPASEFRVPEPAFRMTAFCHDGGFGQDGGFWSGDYDPDLKDPLKAMGW
jgi:hypothetical protein